MNLAFFEKDLVYEQFIKLLKLFFPVAIIKLSLPARGFFLSWIFSRLGNLSLSAGAISFSLFFLFASFLMGSTQTGVGILSSRAIGAKDFEQATCVFQQGIWSGLFLSIPGALILYFSPLLFFLSGQKEEMVLIIEAFIRPLSWGLIPFSVIVNFYKFFNILQRAKPAIIFGLSVIISSCLISYALALGKLGFPKLEIAGVGIGMTCSYWIHMILIIFYIKRNHLLIQFPILKKLHIIKLSLIIEILKIGMPVALKNTAEYFLFFSIAFLLSSYSQSELPAYQIILQYLLLSSELAYSVWVGSTALIGEAIGGKKIETLLPIFLSSLFLIFIFLTLVILLCFNYKTSIINCFFPNDSMNFQLVSFLFPAVLMIQFFDGLRKVITGFLISLGESFKPLVAEILCLWIFALPVGYLSRNLFSSMLKSFLLALVVAVIINNLMLLKNLVQSTKKIFHAG